MPETLPRHVITETPEIAEVLDRAAQRWPTERRAALIGNIIRDWADNGDSAERRFAARVKMIGSWPGTSGVYNRAEDWPA